MSTASFSVHPSSEAVTGIHALLDGSGAEELWRLSDTGIVDLVTDLERARARLDSLALAALHDLDTRGLPVAAGAASTATWLRDKLRMHPGEAKRRVKLAAALDDTCPATAAAHANGDINTDHAHEITKAIRRVGRKLPADERDAAEARLLDFAETSSPEQVAKLGKYLGQMLDPDGPEPREHDARRNRGCNLRDLGNGSQRLTATLPDLEAAKLLAALDPLAAPRPAADGLRDDRTPTQRRHDALVEIIDRHLDRGETPAVHGERPHLVITAGLDLLLGLPGAAPGITATGELVSAELLHKLACDAAVTRVFTDPKGQPLDVGRKRRVATPAQWVALTIRDRGCTGPGCTMPAAWTKAHHMNEWQRHHGETNLNDMCLVCSHCHDLIHHHGWQARMGAHGWIEFIPPAWANPDRTPIVNQYWRPPDLFTLEKRN